MALTPRELEILALIDEGQTAKEMADALFVSKRTIDFHIGNLFQELNVHNRIQALKAARKQGLLTGIDKSEK